MFFQVEGAIDLMDFFCYDGNKYPSDYPLKPLVVGINAPTKLGLASLANTYLNRVLEKDWRVRASDWEDEYLDDRQVRCYYFELSNLNKITWHI